LELPECSVGFYDSLVVFDHQLGKVWLISTGLDEEGDRCPKRTQAAIEFWTENLASLGQAETTAAALGQAEAHAITSTLSHDEYCAGVRRIIDYIWHGDIYQANLTHRLATATNLDGWELYQRLATASPAPFSAFMQCGDFQLASSSPEQFLQLSGSQVTTRPIKGTRPRSATPDLDARLGYELQSSEKERAELVMITDLLRNDLGRFCEYGSVIVPELAKLERFAQVQHLVSTVTGRLRLDVTHLQALASSFPGGSITGAPKIRAMEIIDELEPVVRGPYTGCLGYLGFNRESQLNILIRTAVCREGKAWFHVGAGIVADSGPEAEYEETLNKAAGWLAALNLPASALALYPASGLPNLRS
ncbi:MAG: aminodeoxychorismate synthase component I, partial [Verrucomicrobiota bacterium]|nr:aminodeoxychorismate synthase component I [Verrucomicrobiota bacterium]